MAEDKPCTIRQLCLQYGLQIDELLICCVFCRRALREFDIWSFVNKGLLVLWKKGFPHACCPRCLEVQALVQWLRRFERCGNATAVEEDTGKPLGELFIRCMGCYKPLNNSEKLFQIEDRKPFTKVAGNWRGFCLNCLTTPPPLTKYFLSVTVRRPPPPVPHIAWGFDPPPPQLSETSSDSSWTVTTSSPSSEAQESDAEPPLSDAESDGETEALI
nr:MAG: E6 protein [Neophocaena asiaeorientalis asiaeorientalis papillomavirus 2]